MKLNTWTHKMRVTDKKVLLSNKNQRTGLKFFEEPFGQREKLKKKSFSLSQLFYKSPKKKVLGSLAKSTTVHLELYHKSTVTFPQKTGCNDLNQNKLTEKRTLESRTKGHLSQLSLEAVIKEAESELCSEKSTEDHGIFDINVCKFEEPHSNNSFIEDEFEEAYEVMEFKKVFSGKNMDDYMTMDFVQN